MADRRSPVSDPARCVLDGVPKVGFYDGTRCPEDVPFPSCLRAVLEYLGDNQACEHVRPRHPEGPWGCLYAYLLGTSGAGVRLLWKEGWSPDNGDLIVMAEDTMEPFRRAFESVGYGFEVVSKDGAGDEALFRQRIVESVRDRGRPVIAFGVVGPPECCLVTGYDEGGDVLVGWSFFQGFPEFSAGLEIEPSGHFRKRAWYAETPGLLLVGDGGPRPDAAPLYRSALAWSLKVMRTPQVHGRASGFAAYQAWTDHLVRDEDFPADDYRTLNDRYMAHFDATGTVAEGRWYTKLFLQKVAADVPALAEGALAAAACFKAEHDLMWDVWNAAGGNAWTEEQVRKLAEPGVRRAIVPIVLRAREKDVEAAAHLERALAAQ